ncbi:Ig-like domain-containing protein [Corynebacterium silvaticum]|uniref:Ig-like domain-containing protein n=1 Tax=Corynebacterium silvaticum TaxID=2320431 RepID=A0A7U5HJZ5_9CORY|nr:Ig-like domain-containing protein [Corynebacterium silvaticum]ARU45181.2 Ig-like domain-containing protein [Corynebacterium silvaticum]
MVFATRQPLARAESVCSGGNWSDLAWKDEHSNPSLSANTYYGPGSYAEVQFTWKAKADARQGDKITFTLPPQLQGVDTGSILLRDSENELVARGSWDSRLKSFVITLEQFANTHFNVHGTAFVSVKWNRDGIDGNPKKFDGSLSFNGCGSGSLNGRYEEGSEGDSHETAKIGEYQGYDSENKVHKVQWTVGLSGKTGNGQRVLVTDNAPAGWSFACDGKYNDGYAPVYVSTLLKGNPPQILRHRNINPQNFDQGGTRHGFGDSIKNDDGFLAGHSYKLNCTPQQISVDFPYGISPDSSPLISLLTISTEKPALGSTVYNTAEVNGRKISGSVTFPSAGGQGRGSKGGFTIEKIVSGEHTSKQFSFAWSCTSQGKEMKSGTIKLANGDVHHEKQLDKDASCVIKEEDADAASEKKHSLKWSVDGEEKEGKSVTISIRQPEEQAVQVVATNIYCQEEPEDPEIPPVPPTTTSSYAPSTTTSTKTTTKTTTTTTTATKTTEPSATTTTSSAPSSSPRTTEPTRAPRNPLLPIHIPIPIPLPPAPPVTTTVTPHAPAPVSPPATPSIASNKPADAAPKPPAKHLLARTGASVAGLVIPALFLIIGGVGLLMIIRRKRNSE